MESFKLTTLITYYDYFAVLYHNTQYTSHMGELFKKVDVLHLFQVLDK